MVIYRVYTQVYIKNSYQHVNLTAICIFNFINMSFLRVIYSVNNTHISQLDGGIYKLREYNRPICQ